MKLYLHSTCRPDGQVSVGFSLMRGKRATMEDFYTAQASSLARLLAAGPKACALASAASVLNSSSCACSFRRLLAVGMALWASSVYLMVTTLLEVCSLHCARITWAVFEAGVLPGHGGPNAADFVRQHLFSKLLANPKFSSDIKTALSAPLLLPREALVKCTMTLTASRCIHQGCGCYCWQFGVWWPRQCLLVVPLATTADATHPDLTVNALS